MIIAEETGPNWKPPTEKLYKDISVREMTEIFVVSTSETTPSTITCAMKCLREGKITCTFYMYDIFSTCTLLSISTLASVSGVPIAARSLYWSQ